ncbi:hypothetical protein FXO38_21836 [Capsicum annuum]|nr:hypothetical protein FXO38_21836 [Capsicum annuum]
MLGSTMEINGEFHHTQRYGEWAEDVLARSQQTLKAAKEKHVADVDWRVIYLHEIGGLPIGGLPYEEIVPEFKELTGVDEKNERFIHRTGELLFLAFQHLQEVESHIPRVTLSKWIKFWCKRVLRYETAPVRKKKKSVRLKSTHNPTRTIPNTAKWSSAVDAIFSKLRVKPSLDKPGDSDSHVEILSSDDSSSKTPPAIAKTQGSSKSVVGLDSRELLPLSKEVTSDLCGKVKTNVESNLPRRPTVTMSIFYGKKVVSELKKKFIMKAWASICTKLVGFTPNHAFSIQDNIEVILNDMKGMGADISPLQNLLGSFFGIATSYDQTRSILVDKTKKIKESEPYLKAKEHFEIVSRERDKKSKKILSSWKSLEKARKKVKKLKAHRDTAKQEVAEMESKVSAVEEEFSKCSEASLATKNASKVVEKKKQVLEAAL